LTANLEGNLSSSRSKDLTESSWPKDYIPKPDRIGRQVEVLLSSLAYGYRLGPCPSPFSSTETTSVCLGNPSESSAIAIGATNARTSLPFVRKVGELLAYSDVYFGSCLVPVDLSITEIDDSVTNIDHLQIVRCSYHCYSFLFV